MTKTTFSINDKIAAVVIATPMHTVITELFDFETMGWSNAASAEECRDEMYNILDRAGKSAVIEYAQAMIYVGDNGYDDPASFDELYNSEDLRPDSAVSEAARKLQGEICDAACVIFEREKWARWPDTGHNSDCDFAQERCERMFDELVRKAARGEDEQYGAWHDRLIALFGDYAKLKNLKFDFELFLGRLVAAGVISSSAGCALFQGQAEFNGEDTELWDDEISGRFMNCVRVAEEKPQRTAPDDDAGCYECSECEYTEDAATSNGVCPVCKG